MASTTELMERLFTRGRDALYDALRREHREPPIGRTYVITRADMEKHFHLVFTYVTEGGACFVLDDHGQIVGQFGHFRRPSAG